MAGLLSRDQLKGIFLNVEELLEHNRVFSLQLRDALEIALDQGDEDLLTVNMARLFLHAAPMLHAFETYCIRQVWLTLLPFFIDLKSWINNIVIIIIITKEKRPRNIALFST